MSQPPASIWDDSFNIHKEGCPHCPLLSVWVGGDLWDSQSRKPVQNDSLSWQSQADDSWASTGSLGHELCLGAWNFASELLENFPYLGRWCHAQPCPHAQAWRRSLIPSLATICCSLPSAANSIFVPVGTWNCCLRTRCNCLTAEPTTSLLLHLVLLLLYQPLIRRGSEIATVLSSLPPNKRLPFIFVLLPRTETDRPDHWLANK